MTNLNLENLKDLLETSKIHQDANDIAVMISMLSDEQRRTVEGIIIGLNLARQSTS